ncbi:hypothetical protein FHS27_006284 [Rhodopirellula rubra]|uniref:Uncharacterized protein n=1 Tax=Aporhodopirellula rubra TaxID=980271 RepID=A0A7W5E6Z7_9BACT|nr:hypothetical protein [Aporhodopirellula rubra]
MYCRLQFGTRQKVNDDDAVNRHPMRHVVSTTVNFVVKNTQFHQTSEMCCRCSDFDERLNRAVCESCKSAAGPAASGTLDPSAANAPDFLDQFGRKTRQARGENRRTFNNDMGISQRIW